TPCFENGKAGIARDLKNGIGFGSSEFVVLRSNENVLPQWLYLNVTSPRFRELGKARMTGTGGLQRVPKDFIESFLIPLPSIDVHMLYMSFIYFEVWQIKMNRKNDFENSLIAYSKDHEKMMLNATTPFAFVEIGESNFIRFLKLIGCDNGKIGSYCTSVKARN